LTTFKSKRTLTGYRHKRTLAPNGAKVEATFKNKNNSFTFGIRTGAKIKETTVK